MESITTATAEAPVWSPLWMWLKTKTDAASVLYGRFPEISTSAPISPTARANASATPERIPGRMFGSTMLRKTRASLAPSDRAASSDSRSSSSSTGCTVRTTKGSVTNSSARTIAVRV